MFGTTEQGNQSVGDAFVLSV